MSSYSSLTRPPKEEVKSELESEPKFLSIFTSRDLSTSEKDAIKFHFPKLFEFTSKYVILSAVNLPSNCIIFNMRNSDTRGYVEKNREYLLSRDHCFIKSWFESRQRGIPWIEQLSQKQLNLCQVHSKIELIDGDIDDFLKYLRSYSKIVEPQSILSWALDKVSKVLPNCFRSD